jgi:hypothetical protein
MHFDILRFRLFVLGQTYQLKKNCCKGPGAFTWALHRQKNGFTYP